MFGKFFSQRSNPVRRAQAMVEFAIALPVLMALLVGIMEVGRMVLIYALVTNASRDAVRYASAYGRSDTGYLKYKYCAGIKDVATKATFNVVTLSSVEIKYDGGPTDSAGSKGVCDLFASPWEDNVNVDTGDRVTVIITATYKPMITFLPISTRTITASSSRTILGIYKLPNN
jgi:Flp pilus assembly protein TadG